ncbi:MAG TPA: GNAT family N-acetyltransferase [Gryllotalpicola sp.]
MSFADEPIDRESAARLREQGLELRLVDAADPDAFVAWHRASERGFYEPADPELRRKTREGAGHRRTTGVYDGTIPEPAVPVATVQSWVAPLSVPGGDVELWAISSVTVSPTHRRRGVARAMLESELRTAARAGAPLAGLVASEATIYGRFGFAIASLAEELVVETRRVRWAGPQAPGRIRFISPEALHAHRRDIVERARARQPGELSYDDFVLDRVTGAVATDAERAKLHLVRYDDAAGVPQGFAVYEVDEPVPGARFDEHPATLKYLVAATEEAGLALWRHVLELDLVSTVRAWLRPRDEPMLELLGDPRAAQRRLLDDLWLRVLDVPAAFGARRYSAPGRFALAVEDPYGFAAGHWLLEVDSAGAGAVVRLDGEAPADAAALALTANELAALYLGGVSAATLARAGRVAERTPGAAALLDGALRAAHPAWLSVYF